MVAEGHDSGALGALLRGHRIRRGLTQEQLAEMAGISRDAVSALERGRRRRAHFETLHRLARALDLSELQSSRLYEVARGKPYEESERASYVVLPDVIEPPHALPLPATSFVGRNKEMHGLHLTLQGSIGGLVSVVGPAGVGKTRLALQTALNIWHGYPDGMHFVSLAGVTTPGEVLPTVAHAFGISEEVDRRLEDAVIMHLRRSRCLLVLDNFEHVLPAASLLSRLVRACPELTVLVTTRSRLGLAIEHPFVLGPMDIPPDDRELSLENLRAHDGTALLLERAGLPTHLAVGNQQMRALRAICVRLDGLPLAIELAAARLYMLSPSDLLDRLSDRLPLLTGGPRDAPDRHRTMRASIDWSYLLLTTDEQRLFQRLSVFVGGFFLDAVEHVCCEPAGDPRAVLETLTSLVDRSLVARRTLDASVRFSLLETMREYASEQVREAGDESAIRARHAAFYMQLAARAAVDGAQVHALLPQLDLEALNLRAALAWFIEREETDSALRIVVDLGHYWRVRGSRSEARRWLREVLALPGGDDSLRAQALTLAASHFARDTSPEGTAALLESSLNVLRRERNDFELSHALNNLGMTIYHLGQIDRGNCLLEEAVHLGRESGNTTIVAYALSNLGIIAYHSGDDARAEDLGNQALRMAKAQDNVELVTNILMELAKRACDRGDLETSEALHRLGLREAHDLGYPVGIAMHLVGLAHSAAAQGRGRDAAVRAGAATRAAQATDHTIETLPSEHYRRRRYLTDVRLSMPAADWSEGFAVGYTLSPQEAVSIMLAEST